MPGGGVREQCPGLSGDRRAGRGGHQEAAGDHARPGGEHGGEV